MVGRQPCEAGCGIGGAARDEWNGVRFFVGEMDWPRQQRLPCLSEDETMGFGGCRASRCRPRVTHD